jgi:tryptophan 2,3-dioxygenase
MKPEEIEQAWEIVYDYTVGDYSAPAYNALRHEMAVQAKMIEIQYRSLYELLGEGNKHIADEHAKDWREQAEAELKGFNEANS